MSHYEERAFMNEEMARDVDDPLQDAERELSALKEKLIEVEQIIKVLADIDPSSLVEPGSEDDRYTLYLSEKRQAHDIHGDDLRRARAFLENANG
jgi:hypothetical protein